MFTISTPECLPRSTLRAKPYFNKKKTPDTNAIPTTHHSPTSLAPSIFAGPRVKDPGNSPRVRSRAHTGLITGLTTAGGHVRGAVRGAPLKDFQQFIKAETVRGREIVPANGAGSRGGRLHRVNYSGGQASAVYGRRAPANFPRRR